MASVRRHDSGLTRLHWAPMLDASQRMPVKITGCLRVRELFAILLLGLLAESIPAGTDEWFLADQRDKHIRYMIVALADRANELGAEFESSAVLLFAERNGVTRAEFFEEFVNLVYWIRTPECIPEFQNHVVQIGVHETILQAAAFHIPAAKLTKEDVEDADIDRLNGQWEIAEDGTPAARELLFRFPDLEAGNVVGISLRLGSPMPYTFISHPVGRKFPIARAQRRFKASHGRSFKQTAQGFQEGHVKKQVLERMNAIESDTYLIADDLPPIFAEPFSPPDWMQSPYFFSYETPLLVSNHDWIDQSWWRRRAIPKKESDFDWLEPGGWGVQAMEAGRLWDAIRAESFAVPVIVDRLLSENLLGEASVNAAYEFVRDELETIPQELPSQENPYPTLDGILERGSADRFQKAFLLFELIQLMGFDSVDVAWIHDPRLGRFHPDFVSMQNVDRPLVRWGADNQIVWMDPSCSDCEMGELPPRLYGQPGRWFELNSARLVEEMDLFRREHLEAKSGYVEALRSAFVVIENQHWARSVEVPSHGRALLARTIESVTLEGEPGGTTTARFEVRSTGRSEFRDAVRSGAPAQAAEWFGSRFEGLGDLSLGALEIDESDGSLVMDASGTLPPLPKPDGDSWTLPPSLIMGNSSIGQWPAVRRSDFWAPATVKKTWVARIPIPSGWESIEMPPLQQYASSHLNYSAEFDVQEGHIVLTRRLHVLQGKVSLGSGMAEIARCGASINAFESTPVVIRRKG